KQFKLLSGWDPTYPYSQQIVTPFVQEVEKRTEGRMTFTFNGPETVSPFEQLEPVGAGVFDFLFTHGAYHFGTTPLLTVADALDGDLEKVLASGIIDQLDKHYQKYGVKLILLAMTPEGGYHIFSRFPVSADGDLKGRKIRGSPTYGSIIEMLGGAMVVLPTPQIYTSLDKGVIDAAANPVMGALEYRWYEVAKYLLRPSFGAVYYPLFMNLNAWNKLDKRDQDIMTEVANDVQARFYSQTVKLWEEEEKELISRGMSITTMGPAQQQKLKKAWTDGVWGLAASKDPAATKALREYARKHGLTP